jgi:hypothetical protein
MQKMMVKRPNIQEQTVEIYGVEKMTAQSPEIMRRILFWVVSMVIGKDVGEVSGQTVAALPWDQLLLRNSCFTKVTSGGHHLQQVHE